MIKSNQTNMKVLVAGDFVPTGRLESLIIDKKFDIVFKDVKDVVSSADFSIVNFESPVVKDGFNPIKKRGPNLKCSEEAVEAIKWTGFNCCTLANNHIFDYGSKGLRETVNCCKKNGIDIVGVGDNLNDANKILYKNIDDKILAVINCCEHEFSIASEVSAGANPLNPIRQSYAIKEARANADFVLVIVHGGHEHFQLPSPRMQEAYRFFIDVGADAVVNHHQHCYSGYELYHEKPIFYGLGNFCFDKDTSRNSIWNEGFMVKLEFDKNRLPKFDLLPYIQCNEEAKVSLMDLEQQGLFYKIISDLNTIISKRNVLNKEYNKWMQKNSKAYEILFQPYNTKLSKGLFARHLLPSFITQRKKYTILNYIYCESHLDRLRNAIDML